VWGTLVGALLIGVINNGMNLLGISPYFQLLVKGLIIIGAVLLDRLRQE
jgi:ribose/xylose/arabinose/galactoside ABC-type transport system permease subunit